MTFCNLVTTKEQLCIIAVVFSLFVPVTQVFAQDNLKQAIALYDKNDFASCAGLLSKDINGSLKNNVSAHYYLASAYLRLGQSNAAIEQYLATSRLAPGTVYDDYSRKALQTLLARASNLPESIKKQLRLQPSSGQANTGTGSRSVRRQSVDETNDPALSSATLQDVDSTFITVLRHNADTDRTLILVCKALKSVPKTIVDDLKSGGITVLVTPTVLEAMPGAAMEKPRGYNHGGGYSNAGALFHSPRIIIGERVSYLSGVPQLNDRVAAAMLHEMGHAYDHVKGGLSQSGKFRDCYQEDFGHITIDFPQFNGQ